jgi:Uma2 family endonuclease
VTALLQHPVGPFTIEDWHALTPRPDGSRLELIWGHFHVTPPPSGQHQYAVHRLCRVIEDALLEAGVRGTYVVPGVGVEISTERRQAFIPDVSVLDVRPVGKTFHPDHLMLAIEVISPGNNRQEQEDKLSGYAAAGVQYYWIVRQIGIGAVTVTAYQLKGDRYVEEVTAAPGSTVTITAAPVPVTFDPAALHP